MKYYWLFKYILYNTFSRKNFVSLYFENTVFVMLIIMPIMAIGMINNNYSKILLIFISLSIFTIDLIISSDESKIKKKYLSFDSNRKFILKQINCIRLIILIDIIFFIGAAIFRTLIRSGLIN